MSVTGKTARIFEALNYRLSTLTLSPTRRVAWPNLSFVPVVGEIYLKPAHLPVRADYAAVGTVMRRHTGLYQVSVFGPVNVTPVTQDEIVDLIVEHFAAQTITRNSQTVRIGRVDGESSVPTVAPELIEEGWRQVPITIPWYCDTF